MTRRALAVLFAAILGMHLCLEVQAGGTPIRVGYFAFPGYHERAEDGHMSGYGYELLQKIASYNDWTYQYVGYEGSHTESLEMLRRGEVDLVTSVTRTPEREEQFLFSARSIGTSATVMTVRAGNLNVVSGDYSTYDGLLIGVLAGNSKNRTFAEFAQQKGFQYTEYLCTTEAELTAALQSGMVDAAVSGSLRAFHNEWVVETIGATDFYVVTRKESRALMRKVDQALEQLTLHDPDWRTSLHTKYYSTDSGGQVMLGPEERRYLNRLSQSGRELTVLVNPDRYPYSYWEEGEIQGVFPEIFDLLAKQLAIPYRILPVKTREEYFQIRERREADIVLDMETEYWHAEREGYKLTDPFVDMSFARLTRSDYTGEIETVAVLQPSDYLSKCIQTFYPEQTVLPMSTTESCIRAVLSRKADCTVLYSGTAEQAVQIDHRKRLTFSLMQETATTYSMGVSVRESSLLLTALSRAIVGLDYGEVNSILVRQTEQIRREQKVNLISLIYARPMYGFVAVFFFSMFVFVCFLLRQRTRNQQKLKSRVEEVSRKYEKQQKNLADALALADQANRAKTVFLNNMSHDIRTPMNAIIGFTALASTHLDNREQTRDYLSKIAQSSNHLLSLINDVLDMSRIESGHVHVENRPENLSEILHSLRNIVQADIHARQLEFYIDTIDISREEICCDRLRLNQILLNLLSNAIKFTEPGGTVSLRVAQKPGSGPEQGRYEFRIRDTGIGMSEEFANHIFEPFTRERTSTVSGIQGTGLGMAITKNIVDMMGGTIEVHSERGCGTEFLVRLEFEFSGRKQDPVRIAELEGQRALVADDDLVSCQSVSKMLREIGMRAEWTRYGREAVIRAGEARELKDPFAVYIVDWSMPDQNGVETVRCIRQAVGGEAPIILFTAYDWADIEPEAREAGVTDFISKPLFSSDLYRTLERSLGRTEQEVEPKKRPGPDFRGCRILLVEDNDLNREIATELLQEEGFSMEWAENGKVAVDMVSNSEPGYYDLILMDVQMPVMNGYEATERIRQLPDPGLARIPVIAMTANAFEEDRQRSVQAGMDGYLAKPIELDRVLELLQEIVRPAQRTRGPEVEPAKNVQNPVPSDGP